MNTFRSKRINLDAAGEARPVPLKKMSGSDQSRISVRASSGYARAENRAVPEEYKTFERGRRGGWGFLTFLFLLFAATVGGFFYWNNRPPQFQGDSVVLTVTADSELVSGDEITYLVSYENQDVIALKTVELDVQWPDGFYYNDSSEKPTSDTGTTWTLGPLDPGEKRQLRIKGQLVGTKGQTQTAVFRLSYRPENINSDFEVKQVFETNISDSQIAVTLTSPDKVLAGQDVTFTAEVQNSTSEPLNDLDIEVGLPKDFDLVSVAPTLDSGHWKGSIAVDTPLTITVNAKVAADAVDPQAWVVEVNQTANEQTRRLLRRELSVTPVTPDFEIELKINGQSADFDADYGSTLNYQLKVTNKGQSAINDVRITALLDSDVIDRKTVQSSGTMDKDTIVWTKENMEGLGSMAPGVEVLIPWKATLLTQGTGGRATVDTVATLTIDGLPGWKKNSPVFVVSVGEGLVFNQGLYWNLGGQQVGVGNLPPVTNEKSVYLVVWSLDSGSQDFDSVNVSSFFPAKVSFSSTGDVDEGTLKYDQDTNRLEWQINNFSTKLLPLKATFQVKLVPTDEDKATVMTVLNPATVVASGQKVFQAKSFSVTTAQVVTTEEGDVGTVIE